jgi:hypothetical protein
MKVHGLFVIASLAVTALAGCSSSTSEEPGPANSDCALDVTLSGGFNTSITNPNTCGGDSTELSVGTFDPSGESTSFQITFVSALAAGQTGTLPVESVSVEQTPASAATGTTWTAPGSACTVTITGSTSSPTDVFPSRYLVTGKGTCSQPAVANTSGAGVAVPGPVTIGAFTFGSFFSTT